MSTKNQTPATQLMLAIYEHAAARHRRQIADAQQRLRDNDERHPYRVKQRHRLPLRYIHVSKPLLPNPEAGQPGESPFLLAKRGTTSRKDRATAWLRRCRRRGDTARQQRRARAR